MCEHETSSLERIKELDYSCQGEIKILVHDICNDCGELLGEEIHVFKYDYTLELKED